MVDSDTHNSPIVLKMNNDVNTLDEKSSESNNLHKLSDTWILWAHLPHDTDWSIKSYIKICSFTTIEETISIINVLPAKLVTNCMLFIMREGITPTWEDQRNRKGGCFSYKISNKDVSQAWKELTYVFS
jgi:translation initiation factor 4E